MTDLLLTDLLQKSFRSLGMANTGVATGGSTTTVVDSAQASRWEGDVWKNGCIFIIRTTDGLAPQGEFKRISSYNNSAVTFTTDTFSAAVGAGDTYMFVDNTYPYLDMIELANDGLISLDMLDLTDITTITMAASQKEYAGAVAWKRSKPWKIERATSSDTNANDWIEITDWDYSSAAAGSTPLIIFKQQYPYDTSVVKIHYKDLHPRVSLYSDKIREEVHPELATAAVIVKALEWYDRQNSGQDEAIRQTLSDARNELDRKRIMFPVTHSEENITAKTIELDILRP